jgi:hypothetical protein
MAQPGHPASHPLNLSARWAGAIGSEVTPAWT